MTITHTERMQKKKVFIDGRIAAAAEERGVLVINTGNGKGKSSAAFGVVARALGHGLKVGVVQFVKGRSDTLRSGSATSCGATRPAPARRWPAEGPAPS